MSWIDDILQWSRAKAAAAANAYPETAEQLARWYQGDDVVDMVKFLYEKEPGLDGKIEKARQDPMFAKIYETVYQSTQAHIAQQVQAKLPEAWAHGAEKAGIPVDALKKQMERNGAQKIAFAVTSSVRSEIESMAWYTGKIAGDTFRETRDAVWKTPEKSILEDPLGWISTLIGNIWNLINALTSTKRTDLEQRGEQYVAADTAGRAEEIVAKMGRILHVEHQMPSRFAADAMVGVYEQLKQKADPGFHLDEAGKTQLRTKFLAQLQSAEAVPPPQLQQPPQTVPSKPERSGYSGDDIGLPGIASDGEAEKAVKAAKEPSPPPPAVQPLAYKAGEALPDYPEFSSANLSKYRSDPGLLGYLDMGSLGLTLSLIGANSDERKMQVIKSYLPDAVFYRDERTDALIIEIDSDRFYWDAPGFSSQDAADAAMFSVKWAPVGKISRAAVPAKTLAGKALTYFGVGTALSAAEDSAASIAAGLPDVDLGNAVLNGLSGMVGPVALKSASFSTKTLGEITKKVASGGIMTRNERILLEEANIAPRDITGTLDKMARQIRADKGHAAAAGGVLAGVAAANTTLAPYPAAAGKAIPFENADPSRPVKPGKTPPRESLDGYEMNFPPMP